MSLPQKIFQAEDYWNLPEDKRGELINGQIYLMSPPSSIHQKLVSKLNVAISNYITSKKGKCEVYPAPFAVNLDANNKNWVEPDLSVICDLNKITDQGCCGSPDFVIEIVSPSSKKIDYGIKNVLYMDAGVREYWIVDPMKKRITVYHYEEDIAPTIYPFDALIQVGIFPELCITISSLLE